MQDGGGDGHLKSSAVTFGVCRSLFRLMKLRQWLLLLGFALAAILGYWLAGTAVPRKADRAANPDFPEAPHRTGVADDALPKFRRGERSPSSSRDLDARIAGAIENQRTLVFKDQASLTRFLEKAGKRIRLMGRLDALNALRVGFADYSDLLAMLDDEAQQSLIFPVTVPDLPQGTVQAGAVPLGSHLLSWLGVTADNSKWGTGVRIAILDTGVTSEPAFASSIRTLNLVDLPADLTDQNGHGTAVASTIIGHSALTPGVAPGADILSIRIADDSGQSDSFLLAQGIVDAANAGARIINISMGTFGDSSLVSNAVDYATKMGALIVAAAGNNGLDQVSYPAAYPGVVAVGAVDAMGNHLDFSNSGKQIAMATPGYGVNTAWTGDQSMSMSGTSFSSPIVAGAVAAIMTQAGVANLSPSQAYQMLVTYANDGGAAGTDPQLGVGMPDIGRVLARNTPGVYDAALAAQTILPPDAGHPYGQMEILVQNRGTEALINTAVQVSTGGGINTVNITMLAPGAAQSVLVPITQSTTPGDPAFTVDSRVVISGGLHDAKPSNDRRVETYAPAGTP